VRLLARAAAVAASAGVLLTVYAPARLDAEAAANTLRLFVNHLGSLQSGGTDIWRIAIFNTGPGTATGFGASGRINGAIVTEVNCPLTLWGGIGSLSNFFECGNNGGYKGELRAGQLATFSVAATVIAPVGGQVSAAVTGLGANGDVFSPSGVTDTGVAAVRTSSGIPTLPAGTTPTPSPSAGVTSGAPRVGTGGAYSLLLAAAFIVSGAGLLYMFTRRSRRIPPGSD
jgi:hypothetical protein